jgi:anthranilate phosphoribosyltransferase
VARRVLAGERGPVRDAVLVNAAAALAAHAGLHGDLLAELRAGIARAADAIDSGAAAATLDQWVQAAAHARAAE